MRSSFLPKFEYQQDILLFFPIMPFLSLPFSLPSQSTIVDGGPVIMAKIFGVFGTKTCSFIKENRTKNGPLVFRTVLCSKHDEKLGNCERKTFDRQHAKEHYASE